MQTATFDELLERDDLFNPAASSNFPDDVIDPLLLQAGQVTSPGVSEASESGGSSGSGPSSPSAHNASLPLPLSALSAKRKGDELLAERTSRKMKLLPSGEKQLFSFVTTAVEEKPIWIAAMMIKCLEKLDNIQPATAQYKLSPMLWGKIENLAIQVLECPALTGYRDDATKLVIEILERHPQWGLTPEVKETQAKFDVIVDRVQTRLTERRSDIKWVMTRFPAANVVDLTVQILAKLRRGMKHSTIMDTKPNLRLCARVAFLRKILGEDSSAKYWKTVDKQLESIRVKFTAYPNPQESISRLFQIVLQDDISLYGRVDLDGLIGVPSSAAQAEVEAVATSTHHDLALPEDDSD